MTEEPPRRTVTFDKKYYRKDSGKLSQLSPAEKDAYLYRSPQEKAQDEYETAKNHKLAEGSAKLFRGVSLEHKPEGSNAKNWVQHFDPNFSGRARKNPNLPSTPENMTRYDPVQTPEVDKNTWLNAKNRRPRLTRQQGVSDVSLLGGRRTRRNKKSRKSKRTKSSRKSRSSRRSRK